MLNWNAGARNPISRFTDDDVKRIHRWSAEGKSLRTIAQATGHNKSTISRILSGKTWRHLHPDFNNSDNPAPCTSSTDTSRP